MKGLCFKKSGYCCLYAEEGASICLKLKALRTNCYIVLFCSAWNKSDLPPLPLPVYS